MAKGEFYPGATSGEDPALTDLFDDIDPERVRFRALVNSVQEMFERFSVEPGEYGWRDLTFVEDPSAKARITTYYSESLGRVTEFPEPHPVIFSGLNLRVRMNETRDQGPPEVQVTTWSVPEAWITEDGIAPTEATSRGQSRLEASANDFHHRFFVNHVRRDDEYLNPQTKEQQAAVDELIAAINSAQNGELTLI